VYDAGEIVGGTTILNLKKWRIVNTFLNLDQKTGSLDFFVDYLLQKSLQENAILIFYFER
jgi:hypothetical protein